MFVESTKAAGHTKQVLAYSAKDGLKVVDKPGVQEVPDHPAVQRLIQEGVIKKVTTRSAKDKDVDSVKTEDEPTPTEVDDNPKREPEKKPATKSQKA